MKFRIIFIVLLILLILLITVFFFWHTFFPSNKIGVINTNSFFSAAYKETSLFNKYLSDWGIWGDNTDSLKTFRIKKIVVELTDEKQNEYILTDEKEPPIVLKSASTDLSWNGIYTIKIYIDRYATTPKNQKKIYLYIFYTVLDALYYYSHPDESFFEQRQALKGAHKDFYYQPAMIPFIISRKVQ